jgi:hypothetical protein
MTNFKDISFYIGRKGTLFKFKLSESLLCTESFQNESEGRRVEQL